MLVATFFVGRLSAQVSSLKSGAPTGTGTAKTAVTPAPAGSKIAVTELKAMAKGFGVNESKFNKCMDDGTYVEKIRSDIKEGSAFGVSGTPSFLINGILVVGSLPQADFEAVIDAELKNGTGDKAVTSSGGALKRVSGVPYGLSYIKGNKNAKVKIMEYTDFECPYCNRAFPTSKPYWLNMVTS